MKRQVIIEGQNRDRTRPNYAVSSLDIGDGAGVLFFPKSDNSPKYFLAGQLDENGFFQKINQVPNLEFFLSDSSPISPTGGIWESTHVIVVDDGRVYADEHEQSLDAVVRDMRLAGGFKKACEYIHHNSKIFNSY